MKKESIIKLLWYAFYTKLAYLITGLILVVMQKYIKPLFSTDFDNITDTVIPVGWICGSVIAVLLVLALVIEISKSLKTNNTSVGYEIFAIIVFGALTSIGDILSEFAVSNTLEFQYNYSYVQSYTALMQSLKYPSLLSIISNTLLLVACGMSLFYKKGMRR